MPKPSNANATHGTSHAAAMLNQDNLAQHTQHHQELDESRDFVREFLDTLDPFSAPLSEPGLEPVELMPDIVLRSPSTDSRPRTQDSPQQQKQQQQRLNIRPAQQSLQHQQQSQQQNQPHKQNKHQLVPPIQQQYQPNSNVDKSKRKKVVKGQQEPQKRMMESRPIIQEDRKHPVDGTRLKDGSGAVAKDDTRQSKKRKQQVDDVEQGVQSLEIRDPHSDYPSSREKRKRQTEGTATKPKAPKATKGKQAKSRLVQDDRHASNQQDEDRRKDPGRRAPLHDLADNQSDDGHDHHNQRRHRRHHLLPVHQQKSEFAVNNKPGKTDSNKPRKILTQSSLIMNQFVSPNISRERITIPGKLDHLGIFKKGKASKKTTIQRDLGNEFSEDAFFNQRTDSRGSRISGRRQEQVIKSAYFTDEKQDQDGHTASKSSSSYGNKSEHEQFNRASIASSVDNVDPKADVKKRAIASTPHVDRHRRDRQSVLSYHSSTHSNQQQLSRANTHRSASTTAQVSSQPLEDALDSLLEINERYHASTVVIEAKLNQQTLTVVQFAHYN
ncbi:MAG: hypothetical protein J3R72DRAFT_440954 [Linnemannia gamsii]|nr:MAG: hypothetical protein J3R72DRAFT_440954 [Linnemannia gamsii]